MMFAFNFALLLQLAHRVHGEPNPPSWPSSVYVFNANNVSYAQSVVDQVFKENGGTNPAFHGQFSNARFAFLFQPGTYDIDINVGYYTSVLGLGRQPTDTSLANVISPNGDSDPSGGALCNFWRSAENFVTTPSKTQNGHSNTMMWAVSQGVSLRRIIVNGNLDLYQGSGYSSGGFLSNSHISGSIRSGSQQQWYTRNTYMHSWVGGSWNMFYQGVSNAPNDVCENKTTVFTSIQNTPVIAEKPYIAYESGKYYLMIPPVERNKVGPTDFSDAQITQIDFSNVYVTNPATDTASSINAKIAAGLHVVFSPGNYNLTQAIEVSRSNITLLGLGFATLMPVNGNVAVLVSDGVVGVRISGLLLQAGPKNSSSLLQLGTTPGASSKGWNFLYDTYARVGGPNNQYSDPAMAGMMVKINMDNVIMDNSWLWRADHDVTGSVVNGNNPVNSALRVYGDNVIVYGLKAEHALENIIEWHGNDGTNYFFQSEFPYDVTAQYGEGGYNAFRVDESVTSFQGYGMGMYSFFRDHTVTVENAIQAPKNVAGVQFTNVCTVFLSGNGGISHVIDDMGAAVNSGFRDTPSAVCKLHA